MLFILVFFGFVMAFNLAFSGTVFKFRTITQTFYSLFQVRSLHLGAEPPRSQKSTCGVRKRSLPPRPSACSEQYLLAEPSRAGRSTPCQLAAIGWGLVGQALLGNFDFYGMYTVDRLVTSVLFTSFVVVCWYR